MNIKDFILSGGVISQSYKLKKNDFLLKVDLYVYRGDLSKPKVVFDGPYENKKWDLKDIDIAIGYFNFVINNEKNIWYKMHESICEFNEKGEFVDLDNEKDYEKVEKLRQQKLKQII